MSENSIRQQAVMSSGGVPSMESPARASPAAQLRTRTCMRVEVVDMLARRREAREKRHVGGEVEEAVMQGRGELREARATWVVVGGAAGEVGWREGGLGGLGVEGPGEHAGHGRVVIVIGEGVDKRKGGVGGAGEVEDIKAVVANRVRHVHHPAPALLTRRVEEHRRHLPGPHPPHTPISHVSARRYPPQDALADKRHGYLHASGAHSGLVGRSACGQHRAAVSNNAHRTAKAKGKAIAEEVVVPATHV